MYFRILKKDIKRKKSMTVILLLFVLIATTFIASSVNNVIIVLRGTDYFFEKAELDDYVMITMREGYGADSANDNAIEHFLETDKTVGSFTMDDLLFVGESNVVVKGEKKIETTGSMMWCSFNIKQQKFFDKDDKVIDYMADGSIYVPLSFLEKNNIKSGDIVSLTCKNGYKKEFCVKGYFKDAFLGSEMMGTHRFLLSENDFDELLDKSDLPYGKIFSIETDDVKSFESAFNEKEFKTLFGGGQSLIKMTYALDMAIAAVLLLVSICLIIISAVMLRFIIVFTVSEDYKEIGIMKAIGIKDVQIRKLYLVKYALIAIVGAALGYIISIPFSDILLRQVSKGMVVDGGRSGLIMQLGLSVLVALTISVMAYISTAKIKKLTPMDAIRSGNNGERFKRKGIISLGKSKLRPTSFLAANDIINELRKYAALLITCIVGIWLVIMPVNTINTLKSDEIAKWFSLQDCDLWVVSDEKLTECIMSKDKQSYYDWMDEIESTLEKEGIEVDRTFIEVIFKLKIRNKDRSYSSFALQGIKTDAAGYMYEEGSAPKYENEVALAYTTAEAIDAWVGDTVKITIGNSEEEFVVSAIYQSMNNGGEGIRFHQDKELDYSEVTGGFGVQIKLKGEQSKAEIDEIADRVQAIYPSFTIQNMQEFLCNMIGNISSRLTGVKYLILFVITAIIIMVVVLMQKMFLIKERGEMGMLKSIGFSNSSIIAWQTKRISIVMVIGMITGVITAPFFSQLTSGQVFKFMGASKIEFVIKPVEVYVIYPLIIFAATILLCVVTMLRVRKIGANDMNQSE